jgi:putative Holliday junction resolvase
LTANADNDNRSIVALDFGLRRIGVATGSCITGAASPLDTIRAKAGEPDWRQLDKIIREWQPDVIVLGLPYNSDGSDSEMTEIVRNFGATLIPRFEIPIEFVDERYTSAEAETLLKEDRRLGVRTKKLKKEDIDAKAAQLIAESWMRSTGG